MGAPGTLGNVIVCDDIREEVRNKKSLMGVFPGGILVADLPGSIALAFYLEYFPSVEDEGKFLMEFRLLYGDEQIAQGNITAELTDEHQVLALVVPRGIATFEREGTFRFVAKINGRPEIEVVSKQVTKGAIS